MTFYNLEDGVLTKIQHNAVFYSVFMDIVAASDIFSRLLKEDLGLFNSGLYAGLSFKKR